MCSDITAAERRIGRIESELADIVSKLDVYMLFSDDTHSVTKSQTKIRTYHISHIHISVPITCRWLTCRWLEFQHSPRATARLLIMVSTEYANMEFPPGMLDYVHGVVPCAHCNIFLRSCVEVRGDQAATTICAKSAGGIAQTPHTKMELLWMLAQSHIQASCPIG